MQLKKKGMLFLFVGLLAVGCSAAVSEQPSEATILEIDPVERSYLIETEDGDLLLVRAGTDFDLDEIRAGETITLTLPDETLEDTTEITIDFDPDAQVEQLDEQAKNESDRGIWCENGAPSGERHPQGETIAEAYGVPYDWVMMRFCQGYGFGEIKIALNLSIAAGVDKDYVFELKSQLGGWGKVRKELGVHGNPHPNKADKGKGPKK